MTGVRPSFRAVCPMLPAPWNCPSNAPDAGSRMEDARDSWLAALVRTPLKASMTTAAEGALQNISLMVLMWQPGRPVILPHFRVDQLRRNPNQISRFALPGRRTECTSRMGKVLRD